MQIKHPNARYWILVTDFRIDEVILFGSGLTGLKVKIFK